MTITLRTLLALTLALTAAGCDGGGGGDKTDDTATDDSGGGGGGGDDTDTPDPETDCEDGTDNDEDGLIDCEDDDCAEVFRCTWPDSLAHKTDVFFDGYEVTCETWIGDFDEQIADCNTNIEATLALATEGLCTECDRTYEGAFNYVFDDCDDQFDDGSGGEPATSGRFGFVFTSETERDLWTVDEASSAWVYVATLTSTDGTWVFSENGDVTVPVDECDNSPLTVGNLAVTLTFTDP